MKEITNTGFYEKNDDSKVCFSIAPRDWHIGEISINDIVDVKWDNVSGGSFPRRTSGRSLYGYADYRLVHDILGIPYTRAWNSLTKIFIHRARRGDDYYDGYSYLKKLADGNYL